MLEVADGEHENAADSTYEEVLHHTHDNLVVAHLAMMQHYTIVQDKYTIDPTTIVWRIASMLVSYFKTQQNSQYNRLMMTRSPSNTDIFNSLFSCGLCIVLLIILHFGVV